VVGIAITIIGLTIVAVGTSMPELVTSIMAAIRKHDDGGNWAVDIVC
jgi:cation:H+ antiporter